MDTLQRMVSDFHKKFGRPVETVPKIRNAQLRIRLIEEECKETLDAIRENDLVEAVDGLCDLIYVCMGAALEFGVDLEPLYAEVHETNMLKDGGPTRGDGKIMKPQGWKPPQILKLLKAQGYKNGK